jgi:hypothetical protein
MVIKHTNIFHCKSLKKLPKIRINGLKICHLATLHLGPLVHVSGIDGGGVERGGDVAEQDAVPQRVREVLDGGVGPHDAMVGRKDLETAEPVRALLPQVVGHGRMTVALK